VPARLSRLLSSSWTESTLIDENTFRPDRMSTVAEPIFVGAFFVRRRDGGVHMGKLPAGYRVVGGISVAYGALLGLLLVTILAAALEPLPPGVVAGPWSTSNPYWLRNWLDLIAGWVLPPVALLLSGCLLFTRGQTALRSAAWASIVTAAVLLLQAGFLSMKAAQRIQLERSYPSFFAGDGPMWWAIPLFVIPPLIWAVVLFATGLRLRRRLRPPS
jgi:hypothetical protein